MLLWFSASYIAEDSVNDSFAPDIIVHFLQKRCDKITVACLFFRALSCSRESFKIYIESRKRGKLKENKKKLWWLVLSHNLWVTILCYQCNKLRSHRCMIMILKRCLNQRNNIDANMEKILFVSDAACRCNNAKHRWYRCGFRSEMDLLRLISNVICRIKSNTNRWWWWWEYWQGPQE